MVQRNSNFYWIRWSSKCNSCRNAPSKIASAATIIGWGTCFRNLLYLLLFSGATTTKKFACEFFGGARITHFPPQASTAVFKTSFTGPSTTIWTWEPSKIFCSELLLKDSCRENFHFFSASSSFRMKSHGSMKCKYWGERRN